MEYWDRLSPRNAGFPMQSIVVNGNPCQQNIYRFVSLPPRRSGRSYCAGESLYFVSSSFRVFVINIAVCACRVECLPCEMQSLFHWGGAYSTGVINIPVCGVINIPVCGSVAENRGGLGWK
jgi:hypothetical protein